MSRSLLPYPSCNEIPILLIDDDPSSRLGLSGALGDDGHKVFAFAFPAQVPADGRLLDGTLLVTDYEMPGENGYSLIRRIRALPPERGGNTPAAALTAYARMEDRMRVLVSGFQLHISKPVDPSELVAVVASLTGRLTERASV